MQPKLKCYNCVRQRMKYSRTPALVALCLMTFSSGCEPFDNPVIAQVTVPRLDPRIEAPCYDPGVANDYKTALTENRVALASCRRQHKNVVSQYNQAREMFGPV